MILDHYKFTKLQKSCRICIRQDVFAELLFEICKSLWGSQFSQQASYLYCYWPPINPTPLPYLRVMWIRTLLFPGLRGRRVTDVKIYPDGVTTACWLTALWYTRTKVEGIVLKSVWHWDSDCSFVNDPSGETGRTLLYVGLLSA